jgi:DNA-binding MurR/RpiR family transcriptional regulator
MREDPMLTDENFIEHMFARFCSLMHEAQQSPDTDEIFRAVALLSDKSRKLIFAGGKFSHSVAEQLYLHSHLLRPGCELLSREPQQRMERSVDFGRAYVLTLFDFRRYQQDSIELALEAKKQRAKVIVMTDRWMSPIADVADVVLVVGVQCDSPFDTLVPAFALTETLISGVYGRLQKTAETRLSQLEELGVVRPDTDKFSHNQTEET